MKKLNNILVALIAFVFCVPYVKAATCEASELNRLTSMATKVKANYEVIEKIMEEGTFTPPDGVSPEEAESFVAKEKVFKINITNLTEDLYIVVNDQLEKEKKTYTFEDVDNGVVSFEQHSNYKMNKYTIEIYGDTETCEKRKIRTIELRLPYFNEYSALSVCNDYKEYYLCQEYVDFELPTYNDFSRMLSRYIEVQEQQQQQQQEEEKKGFIDYLKENKGAIIIITMIVVVIGSGITVVIVVRRRRVV